MRSRTGSSMLALLLVVSAGVLQRVEAQAPSPLSQSATAFNPDSPACSFSRLGYSGAIQDFNNCTYDAPINLPHNVFVTRFQISYDSSQADASTEVHFEKNDINFGHTDLVVGTLPPGQFGPKTNSFTLCHRINNNNSHYGVWLAPDANFIAFRVKVFYQTAACSAPSPELPGSNG